MDRALVAFFVVMCAIVVISVVVLIMLFEPEGVPDSRIICPADFRMCPDGTGVGTDTASVRAERAGNGNGRVYTIDYTAADDKGATCSGDVTVSVPKSKGKNGAAVDDGPTFDSTTP